MTAHHQFQAMRDGRGLPMALCTCDDCGAQEAVRSDFDKRKGDGVRKERMPVASQCVTKLQAKGWSYVRRRLRCPDCVSKNHSTTKRTKEDTVTKTLKTNDLSQLDALVSKSMEGQPSPSEAPLPEPSAKQTRLIMMALEEAYDDAQKRYRGEATDKTLAEELGDGIRPGWVAQLREQFFGPAGGNEMMARLGEEFHAWLIEHDKLVGRVDRVINQVTEARAALDAHKAKVKEFSTRLETICRNVGPKAGR